MCIRDSHDPSCDVIFSLLYPSKTNLVVNSFISNSLPLKSVNILSLNIFSLIKWGWSDLSVVIIILISCLSFLIILEITDNWEYSVSFDLLIDAYGKFSLGG